LRILELGAYDGVLGMDWLDSFSPMTYHWKDKRISFDYKGKWITLQGVLPDQILPPEQMDFHMLQQLHKSNDIWAMAVLEHDHELLSAETEPTLPSVQVLLSEFADVFAEPKGLPPHRQYDHAIALEEHARPPNIKPYRYSPLQKDEIERQVAEMLQSGVIVHSMSPFAAPVLLVKKKDGSWRLCIDYRQLNALTVKNRYPMPVVEELMDELSGAQLFTKLDLQSRYHQIRMVEKDEHKTAFRTHSGHFEFRVMPFGLTCAPATFQSAMNNIFASIIRKFVLVFVDDILIYSSDLAQHVDHLQQVFSILKENHLFVKRSKCSFAQTSLEYLGHIVSASGVSTDPAKITAVQNWPQPTNVKQLKGFLGLAGYYRKFIRNFSVISRPLSDLLKKNVPFVWNKYTEDSFHTLKLALVQAP
jgi:hypothetical protein